MTGAERSKAGGGDPPTRHRSVHELRGTVSARHKALASTRPVEEAVSLIQEEYGADLPSSQAFVAWLRGAPLEEPRPQRNTAVDRSYFRVDLETGEERRVETDPGRIPPGPA